VATLELALEEASGRYNNELNQFIKEFNRKPKYSYIEVVGTIGKVCNLCDVSFNLPLEKENDLEYTFELTQN
jgi:hypothetical protein